MLRAIVNIFRIGDLRNRVFFTLAMFVLAFGVLLTGPGMLAVDTLLWPGKAASPPAEPAE